jgi:hypothetical protein
MSASELLFPGSAAARATATAIVNGIAIPLRSRRRWSPMPLATMRVERAWLSCPNPNANANAKPKVALAIFCVFLGRMFIHDSAASTARMKAETASQSTPLATAKRGASNAARTAPNEGRLGGSADSSSPISPVTTPPTAPGCGSHGAMPFTLGFECAPFWLCFLPTHRHPCE